MKFNELYKLLEANGLERKEGAKHTKYVHSDFQHIITVGRHSSKEVPKGTLNKILKDAKLK